MKTLVIYYSYTGKTREAAKKLAQEENADIVEVKETKTRSKVGAYVIGSLTARKQKETVLQKFECDFTAYDKIIIAMPIWADYPAPAFNNIVKMLPGGKEVDLVMTSGSGNSRGTAEKTKELVANKGCKVTKYLDVKS